MASYFVFKIIQPRLPLHFLNMSLLNHFKPFRIQFVTLVTLASDRSVPGKGKQSKALSSEYPADCTLLSSCCNFSNMYIYRYIYSSMYAPQWRQGRVLPANRKSSLRKITHPQSWTVEAMFMCEKFTGVGNLRPMWTFDMARIKLSVAQVMEQHRVKAKLHDKQALYIVD